MFRAESLAGAHRRRRRINAVMSAVGYDMRLLLNWIGYFCDGLLKHFGWR